MKRVNYYLSEPLIEKLSKLSKKKDICLSEVVRRALEEYIEKEDKKIE